MKIAVVSPSPVPFTIGGAENLAWGLCESINKYTNNQAELIKLPSKEHSFWGLIDTYYAFYKLDLSHFDMVISTKYPAWMIRHKNNTVYMLHTLRGLYDTYHLMKLPMEVESNNIRVKELIYYMDTHRTYKDLKIFFERLYALKEERFIEDSLFAFPGPFIRKIVHYMDFCALSQPGMKKWAAISSTVKNREDYFPDYADVEVIYPPTIMKDVKYGEYNHIFFCSRLDAPKRIDMLVKAMKLVKSDVKLYIAGTGPEREKLEKLAEGDSRIEFLGFVSDEDVENYYANAICVPYFPYDEDYGYITIEAMLHKKPVVTTRDSGGPNEFVKNGINGFITDFNEQQIADKIDWLCEHRDEAKKMGEKAYETVKDINWESVVNELLDNDESEIKRDNNKKKIVITNTFSIYPPTGGGQARIYNLYKALAKEYEVEIVAYSNPAAKRQRRLLPGGLIENVIPITQEHAQEEYRVQSIAGKPVTDIVIPVIGDMTPAFGEELNKVTKDADMVIICHPFTYLQYKKNGNNKPFAYEAQDIEYKIKSEMFKDCAQNEEIKKLLDTLYEVEKECCEKSEFIFTCSEEDKETIVELYNLNPDKVFVVANGVDVDETAYTSVSERLSNKSFLGLENEKMGIFMGSWHVPNLEAGEIMIEIAQECPDTKLLMMGSMCSYFKSRELPENVGLLGLVSEEEKSRIFSTVDFALNPMYSGSGTNLKMFDYMSAGIPVITSEFGTRGIEDKSTFIIAEKDTLAKAINEFDLKKMDAQIVKAREIAENTFDWKVIAKALIERVKNTLE
ncbi:MAG: glycosyltransferase family 4 protein [Lachnospiraceae bacterium]|nr:glycosyltransferase family 4 protein [Lachnospiraceae bacterium]